MVEDGNRAVISLLNSNESTVKINIKNIKIDSSQNYNIIDVTQNHKNEKDKSENSRASQIRELMK